MTRSLVALSIALCAAVPAAAQVVRQDSTPLSPIVVTATRTAERESTLASSITVLQGDDLRRAGITSVADALRSVAGAAVVQSSYGSVTSLFLRGGQSNYVRVLVDGVPANMPGGSIDLSTMTTANIERIELVRGPSSVLYGSDAVTGVLQIITRQGRGAPRLRAEGRGGSMGSSDLSAELSAGSAKVGATAAFASSATDGLYDFNNHFSNSTGSASLRWQPDARTDVHVNGRYTDAVTHVPTSGSGVPDDSNQYQTSRGPTVSVDAGRFLSSVLETRLQLGFRESKDIFDDSPDNAADSIFSTFHSDALVDRKSADLRLNLHSGPGTVFTVGGVVEAERERSSNTFSAGTQTIERTNRAAYAQAVTSFANRFWVQGGLRVEDNQAFGSFVTFRLGGTMQAGPHTRVRANIGTAFKEPTFIEQYSSGFSIGNPDLNPERSFSWEAGFEQELAQGRSSFSATFFSQQFRDMIQYDGAAVPPATNYHNIAGAESYGVEARLTARPASGLRFTAEYTWLHTSVSDSGYDGQQYAEGERLIRRPTNSGSLSVDVVPAGRVSGGARWLLVGTRSDLDFGAFPAARVELPGYGRMDLWAAVQLLRGANDVSLTARAENVTDKAYQEVFGFPVPGRRILVGGKIDFGR